MWQAGLDDAEACGTLSMGAGFALYLSAADAPRAVAVAAALGVAAWVAGEVQAGEKQVVIDPIGVCCGGHELALR